MTVPDGGLDADFPVDLTLPNPDTGIDAGATELDLGAPDTGPMDAPDVGPEDAGPLDLGPPDSGPADAGEPDLGVDAGPRCGDGTVAPLLEQCDDGNTIGSDLCDGCSWTRAVWGTSATESGFVSGPVPSMARDGQGHSLLVYSVRTRNAANQAIVQLRAIRIADSGAILAPTPIVLADNVGVGYPARPSVVGLTTGGFYVVWADAMTLGNRVYGRLVSPSTAPGLTLRIDDDPGGTATAPRVVSLGNTLVIGWVDSSALPEDAGDGVRARTLDLTTGMLGTPFALASNRAGDESELALAANGTTWAAVWSRTSAAGTSLVGRRFTGAAATDLADVVLSVDGQQGTIAALPAAGYAVAYVTPGADARGDIQAGTWLPGASALTSVVPFTFPGADRLPCIAAFGADWAVVSQAGSPTTALRLSPGAATTFNAQVTAIATALSRRGAEDACLAPTPFGAWLTWTERAQGLASGSLSGVGIVGLSR